MKHGLLICILSLLLGFFKVSTVVLACSGGGGSWMDIENDLSEASIVVRGSGIINENGAGVLVSEYLVGEPDYRLLRVYYFGKGHVNASLMGYYTGSCGHDGIYPITEEAYYVMTRQQDGTYRIHHIIKFPSENHQFVDTSAGREYYSLTEAEFLERIEANPQPPLFMDMEFPPSPLLIPGLILTEGNNLYLLPIDARTADDIRLIAEDIRQMQTIDNFLGITTDEKLILHEILSGFEWTWDYPEGVDCSIIDCITFSENGLAMTLQVDADTVQMCELALIYPNSNYVSEPTLEQHPCIRDLPTAFYEGAGVKFTPDSNYMAIWDDNQITIYEGLAWLNHLMAGENQTVIISTTLDLPTEATPPNWFAGRGVWSRDSRWLAYSDAQGLWLWDVFTQAPQLYLPTSDAGVIPYARFFSESGRYIAVSIGDEHFIMDHFSDLIFPDGVIRPDERMMIRRDTVNQMPVPAETCSLLDGQCTPLIPTDPTAKIRDVYWMAHNYRPNEWVSCYVVVETSAESQTSGSCWNMVQHTEYSVTSSTFQLNINAEEVLDSPIKSLLLLARD